MQMALAHNSELTAVGSLFRMCIVVYLFAAWATIRNNKVFVAVIVRLDFSEKLHKIHLSTRNVRTNKVSKINRRDALRGVALNYPHIVVYVRKTCTASSHVSNIFWCISAMVAGLLLHSVQVCAFVSNRFRVHFKRQRQALSHREG